MKRLVFYLSLTFLLVFPVIAQRQMEKLDRGVVVVNKGNNQLFISWRFFATDPEDLAFNVYRQVGSSTPVLLNAAPITGATNLVWTVSGTALSTASRFFVKPVLQGFEGQEEGSWNLLANKSAGFMVKDILFQSPPAGYGKMSMKFCWPGDLDGDGRYDYVIDRHPSGLTETVDDASSGTVFVEAYNSDGTFKWRVNAGVNVIIGSGQADMVTVYDLDNDGKAEVCMAVSEGTTFPNGTVIKNADGTVKDYTSIAGSAPQWIAVLDGQTGNLIDTVSLSLFNEIKSDRTDKWKAISGQFIIQYLDGIHPSVVYQYKTRRATGHFLGGTESWRLLDGQLVKNWAQRYHREDTEYESHQFRTADVDADGKDELVQISYTIDDNGSLLNIVPNIAHGDRHCVADMDPDRPGMEHFFIQQTNILGMGINDAKTGEIIKAQYLSEVADIGRGLCAAFDPGKRGMQYYSTIAGNAIYDSKGKLTGGTGSFPAEALWWGGSLSRYEVDAAGSDKNPILEAYNTSTKSVGRNSNLYKMDVIGAPSDYYIAAPNGGRAAFWGDLLGDWREELVYARRDTLGFVILSTSELTTVRQYCLMQNPAYRCQTTHRGYYQTADVDFYMAADMPTPPVAPVQTADVYMTTGNTLSASTHDNKSVMLDIRNPASEILVQDSVRLTRLWLMNPKGHNYTIGGPGAFTGTMDVVKSMQGDVILNGNQDYTGRTRISEGRLFVNGTLKSPVRLDARGVLGGNATILGGITLEAGLNIEGGRLEPGNGDLLGTMNIVGNLVFPGRNTLAFDLDGTQANPCDQLNIQGDFSVSGTNNFIVLHPVTPLKAKTYTLVAFTGTSNATKSNFTLKGLEGVPYTLSFEPNAIKLTLLEPRPAAQVEWQGTNGTVWDFETKNFLKDALIDIFVPGDTVAFNDNAPVKTLTLNETMLVGNINVVNSANYKISGDGVISGNGGLLKTGSGALSLLNEENTFKGGIDFSDGVLEVSSLKDGGLPSSIGASSSAAGNWIMRNATLKTASQMATNRNMTVVGKLTVNNPASNNSVAFMGNLTGTNTSLELVGAGALNVQGSNNFGSVTVKSGTLALGSINANNYGVGTGVITLEGGTLQMRDANSTSTVGPWANTIDVPAAKTAAWNLPMRWNFTNKLTGSGTLILNIPYVRDEFRGDWSAFAGTLKLTGGGDFRINNDYGYGKALIDLASGNSIFHLTTGKTIKIGGLSGVGGSSLSGSSTTWMIGGNSTTEQTFAGVIGGSGSKLTKEGTGTLILTGANTYTGVTEVTNGLLWLANTTGSATGTNSVTVRSGGKLGGTGTASGSVTVYATSCLQLQNNSIGTFSIGGSLTLASGSILKIDLNAANGQVDAIKTTGAVNLSGNLVLNKMNTTGLQQGNEFKIFNTTAAITGSFESIEPTLPEGLAWDQSKLSTGILAVKLATSTNNLQWNDQKPVDRTEYYSPAGLLVSEFTPGLMLRKTYYKDGTCKIDKVVGRHH